MERYCTVGDDITNILSSRETNPFTLDVSGGSPYESIADMPDFRIGHGSQVTGIRLQSGLDISAVARIFGVTESRSQLFFDYDLNHAFPETNELVAFSSRMGLDFYRTSILALKGSWEYLYGHKIQGWESDNSEGVRLIDVLTAALNGDGADPINLFQPDASRIFQALQEHGPSGADAGYDEASFGRLLKEMRLNNLHLRPNNSLEVQAFIERIEQERGLASQGSLEEQETYWTEKMKWLELSEKLGAMLVDVENKRLENENIKARWLSVFGEEFIAMQEQYECKAILQFRVDLKENFPEWTLEEIDRKVSKREAEARERIDDLKVGSSIQQVLIDPGLSITANEDELARLDAVCRKIVRKTWFLLHPDRLKLNPAYQQLTERQKLSLEQLLHRLNRIQASELGSHPYHVGWNHRSPAVLLDILHKAEKILENAGIDVDVDLIVKGRTLSEKIALLREDIKRLEAGIRNAKGLLVSLSDDPDVRERRKHLACPEQFEAIKARLLEQAEKYRQAADDLEERLSDLFKEEI